MVVSEEGQLAIGQLDRCKLIMLNIFKQCRCSIFSVKANLNIKKNHQLIIDNLEMGSDRFRRNKRNSGGSIAADHAAGEGLLECIGGNRMVLDECQPV